MGKKKHDRKHGDKHAGKHGDKHGKHSRAEAPFVIPPHVAGLAAAAIEQVNTPAFRQMIAGALGAATQAFDQRRPRPAAAPIPPEPPRPAGAPPHPPSAATLTPEAEQAIERVAAQAGKAIETAATIAARALDSASEAMARWAAKQAPASGEPAAGRHD